MGGLCGYIILIPVSQADDVDTENSLTILKDWTPTGDVNGAFEAERRAWLASLRAQLKKENIDPNEIIVEALKEENEEPKEFSRDTLRDYVDQIKDEIKDR